MSINSEEARVEAGEAAGPASRRGPVGPFLTTLWFGLLAGWAELGAVLARRAIDPRISVDALRTNRHFAWMIPVADGLIFAVVAVAVGLLARLLPGPARRVAFRLPVGLAFLCPLLTVEGLSPVAALVLACGLGWAIGPMFERRPAGFDRLVRFSLPAMVLGLLVLTGLAYERVRSAEDRALSLRPPSRPGAPNVLLIVLDDVRAASLSLHGYGRPTSPNLQRLASRGVVFSEARSTSSWTLPSHASMLTGRWPHELSVGPDLPLDGTFPTLAESLARRGYATAGFVGNTTYCHSLYGIGRGFARYEDMEENRVVSVFETVRSSGLGRRIVGALGYPASIADGPTSARKSAATVNRDALGWLSGRPADEPFFLFVNYYDAHTPYYFQGDPDPRFGMAALPEADLIEIDRRFWDMAAGKPTPPDVDRGRIVNDAYTLFQDSYDSCIASVDRHVGLLLEEIGRRGQLENTLIIVTSDHGEQLGERGLLGHGVSLYRREVHVPLVVVPPAGLPACRVVDEPVSNREIAATVAEWAAPGSPHPFPGRTLGRFLADGPDRLAGASPVLCEIQHIRTSPPKAELPSTLGPISSIVSGDRVYIRGAGGREELFDLSRDELESVDLAKEEGSRPEIERLRRELGRLNPGAIAQPAQTRVEPGTARR